MTEKAEKLLKEMMSKKGKLFKPSKEQVPDVDQTFEYWVKCRVKMKCIGLIQIWHKDFFDGAVKFIWKEKY